LRFVQCQFFQKAQKFKTAMQLFETLSAFIPRKKQGKATVHIVPLDGAVTVTLVALCEFS
jgi:hypothetical protein